MPRPGKSLGAITLLSGGSRDQNDFRWFSPRGRTFFTSQPVKAEWLCGPDQCVWVTYDVDEPAFALAWGPPIIPPVIGKASSVAENDLPAVIAPPIASLDCGRSSIDHWAAGHARASIKGAPQRAPFMLCVLETNSLYIFSLRTRWWQHPTRAGLRNRPGSLRSSGLRRRRGR
jgi:hypothetical protein